MSMRDRGTGLPFLCMYKTRQSGNVLFLILIAVALFSALSYVIIQSGRSGGASVSKDKSRLIASEIFNYVTAVQTGLVRLQTNGCKENQISFDNPANSAAAATYGWTTSGYANANAPADHSCDIFHPNGGGVAYKTVPDGWQNSPSGDLQRFYYSAGDILENVGTTCNVRSCAELNINLWGLTRELCEAINESLGYSALNASLPSAEMWGCPFVGSYDCSGTGDLNETFADPALKGKTMVCYNDINYGPTFNAVLQAR